MICRKSEKMQQCIFLSLISINIQDTISRRCIPTFTIFLRAHFIHISDTHSRGKQKASVPMNQVSPFWRPDEIYFVGATEYVQMISKLDKVIQMHPTLERVCCRLVNTEKMKDQEMYKVKEHMQMLIQEWQEDR